MLPAYNWGGVYIGINGGWGWDSTTWTAAPIGTGILANGLSGGVSETGGVVGGTLGANFQADGFVFGVEGDWDYSAINTGTTHLQRQLPNRQ